MLPIQLRLPKPPAVFVGRTAETNWLAGAIERSPVAIIAGWQGMGKSALLARFGHDELPTSACVRARGVLPLAKQLGRALGIDEPPAETDACCAYLAELCEDRGLSLILEDAHEFGRADDLALLVLTFARFGGPRGRLFVLTRERPAIPDVAEQTLWLEPLALEETVTLVRSCAPSLEAVRARELAIESHGSPRVARELAIGGKTGLARLLSGLPARARELLRALAATSHPIPVVALPVEIEHEIDALGSLGFVEHVDSLVRLPEVVRAATRAETGGAAPVAASITRRLLDLDMDGFRLQAVELALAAGSADLIDAALDRIDDAAVDSFGAAPIFQLLATTHTPAALRVKLLCVARSPDREGLHWLASLAPPKADEQRLVYARALIAGGERETAKAIYRELGAASDPLHALDAAIGFARSCAQEQAAEAIDGLRALQLATDDLRLRRDVYVALVHYRMNEEARGREVARRVHARLHLAIKSRALVAGELYTAFAYLRLFRDAARLARDEALGLPFSAERLYIAAVVAVETADDAAASAAIDRLSRVARGASRYLFLTTYLRHRALAHTDLTRATALVRQMRELGETLADDDFLAATRCCEWEHALRTGRRRCAAPAANPEEERWSALVEARLAGATPSADPGVPLSREEPLLRAERAIFDGDFEHALKILAEACAEASERDSALEAADYAISLASTLLRAPSPSRSSVQECLRVLDALASEQGLSELSDVSRGVQELLKPAPPSRQWVEEMSQRGGGLTARLARSLLDGVPPESACDREILLQSGRRWSARTAKRVRLDHNALVAELPDGQSLDLSKHKLLFRLVEVLAAEPIGVSKERLAVEVWSVRSYLPARDDKRIQVAVKRLRDTLDQQALPPIIATTPTGYALKL